MQNSGKIVASLFLAFFGYSAFSFQDSNVLQSDTTKEKEIQVTPYFSKERERSFGNYVGVVDDSLSFQLSSGISVFNTLRGQIPSTAISNHASFATVRKNAIQVIDGLVYQQGAARIYNINAFDYSSLTVLSRGNAASAYGVYGGRGAYILRSKSGENQFRPAIEFNSYATVSLPDHGINSEGYGHLSNSIAYMQDFGKIDTRVSYNNFTYRNRNAHNIKINTGFEVTSKFTARVIIDNIYASGKSSSSSSSIYYLDSLLIQDQDTIRITHGPYTSQTSRREKNNARLFQGNLILNYQPLNWLTLTSQSSWGKINESDIRNIINNESRTHTESSTESRIKDIQQRSLVNFFARANKKLGSLVSFAAYGGIQYETWKDERRSTTNGSQSDRRSSYKNKSYMVGIDMNIHEIIYGQFVYRKDMLGVLPKNAQEPIYSSSLAFIFSDAFHWKSSFFSFGKARASFGRGALDIGDDDFNLPITQQNIFEAGIDLSFLQNRLQCTFNYFEEKAIAPLREYSPSTGFTTIPFSPTPKTTGTELIITSIPVMTDNMEYTATLLWSRSSAGKVDYWSSGFNGYVAPDLTSSLLNNFRWQKWSFRFLADITKYPYGKVHHSWEDVTQIKVRDVSVSYQIKRMNLGKVIFQQLQVTMSARNMALLYSTADDDAEEWDPLYEKTLSIGLSVGL